MQARGLRFRGRAVWVFLVGALSTDIGCTVDTTGAVPPGAGPGGSASSSTSSGAGGEGGTAPGSENCLNGVDDDNNGLIDCEDLACSPDYECVTEVPIGFSTEWAIEIGDPAPGNTPTCPDGSVATARFVGPAMTTECAPCGCNYTGYACSGPTVACAYNDGICSGINHTVIFPTQTCTAFPGAPGGPNATGSCNIVEGPRVSVEGSCTGGSSAVLNTDPFEKVMYTCSSGAAAGKGCGAGQVCRPRPSGDLATAAVCAVTDDTGVKCPAGFLFYETEAYDDFVDLRACSSCTCDSKSVKCTGGAATVYDAADCTVSGTPPVQLPMDGACISAANLIDNASASVAVSFGAPGQGTCTAAIGSGSVMTSGVKKVCCR